MKRFVPFALSAVLTLIAASSASAVNVPDKCEAGKNSAAGKYAACRQAAEAKAIKTGLPADFSKCDSTLADKWSKLEDAAGGACPTNGDDDDVKSFVTAQSGAIATALAGDGFPSCGNGVVDQAGEHCDGADFDGSSCGTLELAGTLSCDGDCTFDASNCFPCPGSIVGDFCWLLSGSNESCETTCLDAGLTYDEATRTYAGSDGNLANCNAVLDALNPLSEFYTAYDSTDFPCPTGWGCVYDETGFEYRCLNPSTTAAAQSVNIRRACACKP